jgi:gliding motility-associated-like protein
MVTEIFMGCSWEGMDNPGTQWGGSAIGSTSTVDLAGNIYTTGFFWDRIVWGCVPADDDDIALYLVKHAAIESPVHSITGPAEVCAGSTINLSTDLVSNGVLYRWFTPEGADPEPGFTLKNSISLVTRIEYDKQPVIVSITDLCDVYFAEPFVLQISQIPQSPVLIGGEALVCPGTSEVYTVQQENNETYMWTLSPGITSTVRTPASVNLAFSDDFATGQATVTASNFCGSANTVFPIGIFLIPQAPLLTGNATLCPSTPEIVRSISPVADAIGYQWSLPANITFKSGFPQNTTTLHAVVEQAFQMGEIRVKALGQCMASDFSNSITIDRSTDPGAPDTPSGPEEFCLSESEVTYVILAVPNATSYTWTIPDIFGSPNTRVTVDPSISLNAVTEGSGVIAVLSTNSCYVNSEAATLTVSTHAPLLKPKLWVDDCDSKITVTDAVNFHWTVNDQERPDLASNDLLVPTDSGRYYVQVENFCGIQKSDVVVLYPVIVDKLLIPNVITPNGDGKNDFLVIDKALKSSNISIYNRWGQNSFSASNYDNRWDGADLATGTYYLIISNRCLLNDYQGWISILK